MAARIPTKTSQFDGHLAPTSRKAQAHSLSQRAYEGIKHQIISLALPPGAVIDEDRLQAELGLGRTPIREALQRLALEKLVTIVPRRGTFVTEIGLMDLRLLFEVRVPLESLATRLAAQRGQESHWQEMEAVLAGMPPTDDAAANEQMIAIDRRCHEIIYEAAANPFLRDILITLYALSLRLWYYAIAEIGHMRQAVSEHQAILEALRRRDGETAARVMQHHIQAFQTEIQSIIVGSPTLPTLSRVPQEHSHGP